MIIRLLLAGLWLIASIARADDQTKTGSGNAAAEQIGHSSPLIESSFEALQARVRQIANQQLRDSTLDAVSNRDVCVMHRANLTPPLKAQIIDLLVAQGLLNASDAAKIPGGIIAGIFPALTDDSSACPHLPLDFHGAPGGATGSHHSYPGGLAVHEAFNQRSVLSLAENYLGEYARTNESGLPVDGGFNQKDEVNGPIDRDVILAAPAWHDWAKAMVMQWNADGTEFVELGFGGVGTLDNYGTPGDSRTGAHHILGLAEAIARGLPPVIVITQASAHSAPTLGNEFKVVNWLRAAAIIARIDPVARGYLVLDSKGNYRLPPLRKLGDINLPSSRQFNLLVEYQIHNVSDADFVNSIPAVQIADLLLANLAPEFGYNTGDKTTYNMKYRNVALAYESGERLEMLYAQAGIAGVRTELAKLHKLAII